MSSRLGIPQSDLNGIQRAAILVMVLQRDVAKKLLAQLTPAEIREVSIAMTEIEHVPQDVIGKVVAEFVEDISEVAFVPHTGRKFVREILPDLLGERHRPVLDAVNRRVDKGFGEFCSGQPTGVLAALVSNESPQTQAVALSLMGPENAARVLARLDTTLQVEIAARMANLTTVPGDLADDIMATIIQSCDEDQDQLDIGGLRATAAVIGKLHKDANATLMQSLLERDEELAENLRMRMVAFEDLVALDKRGMQTLLKNVSRGELVTSLNGASSKLVDAFLGSMSSRAAQDVRDEIEIAGRQPHSKVEVAQFGIAELALRLASEGEIYLPGGPGDSAEGAA